jgi:hypothetical protein
MFGTIGDASRLELYAGGATRDNRPDGEAAD